MENFTFYNPVNIVFGKGSIAKLNRLVPSGGSVLLAYGGGSIKANGVYRQVMDALQGRDVVEFGGIEPNPKYETLLKAIELVKERQIGFLLAVGGGSVLDGVKFIAAAVPFAGDPWEIMTGAPAPKAVPLGAVLTLPATGSEMNCVAVISRKETQEKLAFRTPAVFPKFSILDPETTYSLPARQVANGVVDAFSHVLEQYLTYPVDAPLQDRMSESILSTLVEVGPKALETPPSYEARASLMWAATMALNGLVGLGVPQDWATHGIGHELTALYGLDHAQTLAVVQPALLRHQIERKRAKLQQYGERVWGLKGGSAEDAIDKTEAFFRSLGVKTRLAEYGVLEGWSEVGSRLDERGVKLGEYGDVTGKEAWEILELCAK